MRPRYAVTGFLLAASAVCAADQPLLIRFSKQELGRTPAGWRSDKTGKGDGSVWKVVADATAPSKSGYALAQTAAGASATFNLCVLVDSSHKDVEVSVAFKAIKGDTDQGGGMVWRYQDENNYYIARYNPLEENLRAYKVIGGKRTQLAGKEDVKLADEAWHTLRVTHDSTGEIACWLNGQKLLRVAGESTIDKPGKVGLWTKADAQTHFDEFSVRAK